MAIETNSRSENGLCESITGFRTSSSGQTPKGSVSTCDIEITMYDPFDFTIDWRLKYVKHREIRYRSNGRRYFKMVRSYISYPYYQFVKKTRTIKAWRLEISSGRKAIQALPDNLKVPNIIKYLEKAELRLSKYGICKLLSQRDPGIQHDVQHYKFSVNNLPTDRYTSDRTHSMQNKYYTATKYGAFESPYLSGYTGSMNTGFDSTASSFAALMLARAYTAPMGVIFSDRTSSLLAAMLWPSSGDMEDIGVTPLVDLSEAASEANFPLGPPPSAIDAHERMVRNAMDDNVFGYLTDIVDFSANAWLWSTLVIEPIVSSAVGLAASVKANDDAIDAYSRLARSEKWIQGKALRLFGRVPKEAAQCFGAPLSRIQATQINADAYSRMTSNITYDHFNGQASFYYKLDNFDAEQLNTSAVRLGQFFNRMSVSFDTVLHNIIPLSFVYDWFSSDFTGRLNLKDKVYLPVAQTKLVRSYKLDFTIDTDCITHLVSTPVDIYYVSGGTHYYQYTNWYPDRIDPAPYWIGSYYCVPKEPVVTEKQTSFDERHELYIRSVAENPVRMTDFSELTTPDLGLECFDTKKLNALGETGKLITLGALLWGFIPG